MKLASFEKITEILPIEGADRIELARVQGWQSVIRKNEYKVGDLVIFVPIDTVIQPAEWNKFLWDKNDPQKPIRVRTAKLRGTVSQGLIFPSTLVDRKESSEDESNYIAQKLGITKYERPIPSNLAGVIAGDFPSHFVSKTDEDNLKSNIEVLEELKNASMVQSTIKMDGTSATYIKDNDGKFYVCSRNLELKESENNAHWQMARKYDLSNRMPNGCAIQGEICGPGIQKNPMGLKEVNFFVFNYKDLNTNTYYREIPEELEMDDIPHVQVDTVWNNDEFQKMTIDTLQEYVNTLQYENKEPAEGAVFRGLREDGTLMYSYRLQKMLSVKIINQNYID